MRAVLIIPLEEIKKQFSSNQRQDIKIVAPEILSSDLFQILKSKCRLVKKEIPLETEEWRHSESSEPNKLVESKEFQYPNGEAANGFAISFANEKAEQNSHYHSQHTEIYFTEHEIEADYKLAGSPGIKHVKLDSGGAIIFSPNVIHKMRFSGLTIVIESPSLSNDKTVEEL